MTAHDTGGTTGTGGTGGTADTADTADGPGALTTEGRVDRDFLGRVGGRVRALRKDRGLTVQQLADRSRISRRLLTQIEHGQANPSLVAITRIARQLGADTTTLLDDDPGGAPRAVDVFPGAGHVLVWSTDRGSTAHLLAATSPVRAADLWLWRLQPGDSYAGHADPERSQELFYVLGGTLTVRADGLDAAVPAGSSARLRSDRPYAYANTGEVPAVFVRTVALQP